MSIDKKGNMARTRGDTVPESLAVKDRATGLPIPLTSYAFVLSLSKKKEPKSADYLFQQDATIIDPANGRIEFPFTLVANNDHFGQFYYQIKTTFPNGTTKVTKKGTAEFAESIDKT